MANLILKWQYNPHLLRLNNSVLKNALEVTVEGARLHDNGYTWIVRRQQHTKLGIQITPQDPFQEGQMHVIVLLALEETHEYVCFKPNGTFKVVEGAPSADIEDFWSSSSIDLLEITPIMLDQLMSIQVKLFFTPTVGIPVLTGSAQILISLQ